MKTLSIIIPVYNEENRIGRLLRAFSKAQDFGGISLEKIIFVDDGSTDKTVLKIKKARPQIEKAHNTKLETISYSVNRGKGYAVRQGMLAADSDYTLLMDCDLSTKLTELTKMLPAIQKNADVVIGTRRNGISTVIEHQPRLREILGQGFTLLSQIMLNTWISDFTCGFKLFSRGAKNNIFKRARIERWGYDSEVLFLARKLGYATIEVPVVWSDDSRSKVNLVVDIVRSFSELLQIRLYDFVGEYSEAPIFSRFMNIFQN